MYLKQLNLYNFRKFGIGEDDSPGATVYLNPNLILIVGENDTGKTAIIDGIRYLLGSVSDDYEKISSEDFYSPEKDIYSDQFTIEGIFTDLTDKEAGAFLEWLSFDDENQYSLRIVLEVKKKQNENGIEYIDRKLIAGEKNSESRLNGSARDLLKTTYLKPLRDAGAELRPGFRSRLVHILKAHPAFREGDEQDHQLVTVMNDANNDIENFFESEYTDGHSLKEDIRTILSSFYDSSDQSKSEAKFTVTDTNLLSILRKLSLSNEDINLGLGNQNLLFIATELLLLNNYIDNEEKIGPNITLIEEIEAHLHTQAQIRLIKFLESKLDQGENSSQFILTSHSPNLVASIDPKNIILVHNQEVYPMRSEFTDLEKSDYKFLERFLDSTKSNLFFAKGIIFVEGESEMLLLPALANLIEYPLHQYGISIVNIRGTSFERYIRLFSRSDLWIEEMERPTLDIPLSIVTDVDVKPYIYYEVENIDASFFSIENQDELDEILPYIDKSKNELKTDYFGQQYTTLKKMAGDFGFSVCEGNEKELTSVTAKEFTGEYINSLERTKRNEITEKYNSYNCNLNVLIAPEWTLEFSLAKSPLVEYLYESVHYTRYKNPEVGTQKEEYDNQLEKIRDNSLDRSDRTRLAYDIFKPLNDNLVSKAEVAQRLAVLIEELIKEDPNQAEKLKEEVLEDDNLRYLVHAIKHAASVSSSRDEEVKSE